MLTERPPIRMGDLDGLATVGIGIRGLTRTRFFPEMAFSTVRLVGVSILPGASLARRSSGAVIITITSVPPPTALGELKRTTDCPRITAMVFTTRPGSFLMARLEAPGWLVSMAAYSTVAVVFTVSAVVGFTAVVGFSGGGHR